MKKVILLPVFLLSVYLVETLAETSYAARYFETTFRGEQALQIQSLNRIRPEGFQLSGNNTRFEGVYHSVPGRMNVVDGIQIKSQTQNGTGFKMRIDYYKWLFFRLFLWLILIVSVTLFYFSIVLLKDHQQCLILRPTHEYLDLDTKLALLFSGLLSSS